MRGTTWAALAVTAGLLLSGCGGGGDDEEPSAADIQGAVESPAASGSPAASAGDDREAQLLVANQGYVDALLAGKIAGVLGYLDPKVCDEDDETSYALGIGQIKDVADGATMKIVSVKLYDKGARGGTDEYELSADAPDGLRRLIKSSMEGSKEGAWNYRDGEWYLAGPCEDDN